MILLIRLALVIAATLLVAAIVWAFGAGHFLNEFGSVAAMPWGKVSLIDLYLGFAVFAVVIALHEPLKLSIPLVIAMFLLGNIIAALWLAGRLPKLISQRVSV